MMKPRALVWLVPAGMSLVAIAPLPYAYYMLLRVVVCGCSGFLTLAEHETGAMSGWMFALIGLTLLFNPFVPVHLERGVWAILNVAAAIFLLTHMAKRKAHLHRGQ